MIAPLNVTVTFTEVEAEALLLMMERTDYVATVPLLLGIQEKLQDTLDELYVRYTLVPGTPTEPRSSVRVSAHLQALQDSNG